MSKVADNLRLLRWPRRLFGDDGPLDLAWVIGFFVFYWVLDVATRAASDIDPRHFADFSLIGAAMKSSLVPVLGLGALMALAHWRSPERFWSRWSALDHGVVLQRVAIPMVLLLTWQGALHDYNFLADRLRLVERLAIVVLGACSVFRPAFLVPFATLTRLVTNQFLEPFGTTAAQNVDELLVIALLVLGGAHLLYVATGRRDTTPVLLVLAAAIATHFFISGRGKLHLDWITENDLSNLPLNSYVAGWRQQGDGGWASGWSDLLSAVRVPAQIATVGLEVGALVAVAHHRLFRLWLGGAIIFHLLNFAIIGFWFLGWIAFEAALLIVLWRSDLTGWVAKNATPARAVIAMAAVFFGGATLFHPPRLAWYDSPLAYGYEVEAIGVSGSAYHVPLSAFAPFEQELVFVQLGVRPASPIVGGYGAIGSPTIVNALNALDSIEEVAALETEPTPPATVAASTAFMRAFMDRSNERADGYIAADLLSSVSPISKVWNGRSGPNFDFREPIQTLDLVLVTKLSADGEIQAKRELVLRLERSDDGKASVVVLEP